MKLRPLGKITDDLEPLLCEMAFDHDMQMAEILAIVKSYLEVHAPSCIEEYDDGTQPIYYYGPKK